MSEQALLFILISVLYLAARVLYTDHRNRKLINKIERINEAYYHFYQHFDCNGGFHDRHGGWGNNDGTTNIEIAGHYDTMRKLDERIRKELKS